IPFRITLPTTQQYPTVRSQARLAHVTWEAGALLDRQVTLTLRNASLGEALDALSERAGITIAYHQQAIARVAKRISIDASGVTLGKTLDAILAGTGWT